MFTQRTFELPDEDYEQIEEWAKNHKCTCIKENGKDSRSCCGGEISVTFTPTAVATFVTAECICGAKIELDVL